MSTEHCSRLDDYLNRDLREAERVAFEMHLRDCESCRRAVEVDRRWEGLLAAAKPVAPSALQERIDSATQLVRARRRGYRWASVALFVAASLMLFLSPLLFDQDRAPVVTPHVADTHEHAAATREPRAVRIEFAPESRVIAMPLASKNPQVSIVWLYPELVVADAANTESN